MKIKPLFDKILLQEIIETKHTGIVLPDIAKDKPNIAKVISIGNGGKLGGEQIEFFVKENDKVLFNKFATVSCKINDQHYLLINQADILAILED